MANGTKDKWDPALNRLLTSLQQATNLPSTEEELGFLSNLLQSKELHALVNVHNKIVSNGSSDRFFPLLSTSLDILTEILEDIAQKSYMSPDCKELFYLLQKPHIQGVLFSHDSVAQKDYYPHLPEIPREAEDDEETIKIVQLVKSSEPLGATIKTDEATGKIVIARVMHGGAADRSGLIHPGDEVVEVNNISVEGKTPNDVLQILQNSEGTITFKLIPADSKSGIRESKVRVRAHFNYDSSTDPYIPCKEAGLDFVKGDVLHIVSQDDAYWWQARKEGDRNMRAGLIPSRALQERRIIHDRTQAIKNGEDRLCSVSALPVLTCSQFPKSPRCASKTKKIIYDIAENDDFDREEIATYEEVAKLYPRPGMYRPIVLIGAPGIGRNELKRRLIDTNPSKYRTPTPYTTRTMKPGEEDGKEYFFVSREVMEKDIQEGKFIEFGEYKGNLYGTSTESVKAIVTAGKVCILNPHYQALKMLRTPHLKPYIIYIKPPNLEILKETRSAFHARSTFDINNSRGFTDDEFNDIIKSAARIEFLYDHFFDETIVNADLAIAFSQLAPSRSKPTYRRASERPVKSTDANTEAIIENRKVDSPKITRSSTKATSLKKPKNCNCSLHVPHDAITDTRKFPRRVTFGVVTTTKPTLFKTYSAAPSLTTARKTVPRVDTDKNNQDFYTRYGNGLKNSTSVPVTSSPGVRKRIHPTGSYFSGTLYPASMRRIHGTDHYESRLLLSDHAEANLETDVQKNEDCASEENKKDNCLVKHPKSTLDDYLDTYYQQSNNSHTCRPIKISVLLHAARTGNTSWLKELIEYNLKFGFRDVNAVDQNGRTLLTWLASRGIADFLTQLSRITNINPNLGDNEGNTPLHYAVRYERTEFLNLFLVYFRGKLIIDRRNILGFTPLICAAIDGRTKSARLLLLSGADPTLRDFGRHLRADQWALYCSRLVCAEVILRQVREQLLKFPDAARKWDSRINMEAVVCKKRVRCMTGDSSKDEGFGMKFKQIFRRTSTPPHDKTLRAKLIKQITTAAFCTTSPALPSRDYLPPIVKSLLRPLTIPLIKITFVRNDGNTRTEIIDCNARDTPSTSNNLKMKSNVSTVSSTSNNVSKLNSITTSKTNTTNGKEPLILKRSSSKRQF